MLFIQYELGNHGWAEVIFTIEAIDHRFAVSYLHDSLLDLACLTSALCEGESQALQSIRDQYGPTGYKERWVNHEFPEAELQRLKAIGVGKLSDEEADAMRSEAQRLRDSWRG